VQRIWNGGRGGGHGWTALDGLPKPTERKVMLAACLEAGPCS